MIFSEICEYLGSGLEVPTEINGFLLSIDASLYQNEKSKIYFYADFMLSLCYYASERNL